MGGFNAFEGLVSDINEIIEIATQAQRASEAALGAAQLAESFAGLMQDAPESPSGVTDLSPDIEQLTAALQTAQQSYDQAASKCQSALRACRELVRKHAQAAEHARAVAKHAGRRGRPPGGAAKQPQRGGRGGRGRRARSPSSGDAEAFIRPRDQEPWQVPLVTPDIAHERLPAVITADESYHLAPGHAPRSGSLVRSPKGSRRRSSYGPSLPPCVTGDGADMSDSPEHSGGAGAGRASGRASGGGRKRGRKPQVVKQEEEDDAMRGLVSRDGRLRRSAATRPVNYRESSTDHDSEADRVSARHDRHHNTNTYTQDDPHDTNAYQTYEYEWFNEYTAGQFGWEYEAQPADEDTQRGGGASRKRGRSATGGRRGRRGAEAKRRGRRRARASESESESSDGVSEGGTQKSDSGDELVTPLTKGALLLQMISESDKQKKKRGRGRKSRAGAAAQAAAASHDGEAAADGGAAAADAAAYIADEYEPAGAAINGYDADFDMGGPHAPAAAAGDDIAAAAAAEAAEAALALDAVFDFQPGAPEAGAVPYDAPDPATDAAAAQQDGYASGYDVGGTTLQHADSGGGVAGAQPQEPAVEGAGPDAPTEDEPAIVPKAKVGRGRYTRSSGPSSEAAQANGGVSVTRRGKAAAIKAAAAAAAAAAAGTPPTAAAAENGGEMPAEPAADSQDAAAAAAPPAAAAGTESTPLAAAANGGKEGGSGGRAVPQRVTASKRDKGSGGTPPARQLRSTQRVTA